MTVILDTFLAICLPILAFLALFSPYRGRAVVYFVLFGSMMALVWVRLAAPDLALAADLVWQGSDLPGGLPALSQPVLLFRDRQVLFQHAGSCAPPLDVPLTALALLRLAGHGLTPASPEETTPHPLCRLAWGLMLVVLAGLTVLFPGLVPADLTGTPAWKEPVWLGLAVILYAGLKRCLERLERRRVGEGWGNAALLGILVLVLLLILL